MKTKLIKIINKVKQTNRKVITIALLATFAFLVLLCGGNGENGIAVNVDYPKRCTITESIPANGKIQPVTQIKITPDVSGEVIEVNVKEGDSVCTGDLLVKIRQDVYLSAVERAEASLNAVRAQYMQQKSQLSQIELSYKRNEMLFQQKAISEADYETALSQYEVARQQLNAARYNIKSAEAAVKEARENLNRTTIYAPIDGIVSKMEIEKGERVVGTSQMAGTELMRIANLNQMEVVVYVNENDIIKLSIADTAYVEVDAYPNRKFVGFVTEIASSARNTGSGAPLDDVTNFEVHVTINSEECTDIIKENGALFRPGMSASVEIITETCHNALVVPLQSVTTRRDILENIATNNINEYIFVYDNLSSQVVPVKVKTGIQDMKNIMITQGLDEGTMIVTGPYSAVTRDLKAGSRVILRDKPENKGI